jgi:hypothetical protein
VVQRWSEERAKHPFASVAELRERVSGAPACR